MISCDARGGGEKRRPALPYSQAEGTHSLGVRKINNTQSPNLTAPLSHTVRPDFAWSWGGHLYERIDFI